MADDPKPFEKPFEAPIRFAPPAFLGLIDAVAVFGGVSTNYR
jgi:hypothetical protein